MPAGNPSAMEGEDKRIAGFAGCQPSFRLSDRYCLRGRWRLTERDPWASLLPLLEHTPLAQAPAGASMYTCTTYTQRYTLWMFYIVLIYV